MGTNVIGIDTLESESKFISLSTVMDAENFFNNPEYS